MNSNPRGGFSLLELLLAMSLSSALVVLLVFLFRPYLVEWLTLRDEGQLRAAVSHAAATLKEEVESSTGVRMDSGQCYAFCLTSGVSQNRIVYYWQGDTLYRSVQNIETNLNCTSGTPFVRQLDSAQTSFSIDNTRFKAQYEASLAPSGSYRLYSEMIPLERERNVFWYEGFECNSAVGSGWTFTSNNALLVNWGLENQASAIGSYQLTLSGLGLLLVVVRAQATFPVGQHLMGGNGYFLKFVLTTTGTPTASENLEIEISDGTTFTRVFNANRGVAYNKQAFEVDLSGLTLTPQSQIRITGGLGSLAKKWTIDEIQIYQAS